jgi:hypothetical protein
MKAVAGCELGDLVKVGLGIERKQSEQGAVEFGFGVQYGYIHPHRLAGNLDDKQPPRNRTGA